MRCQLCGAPQAWVAFTRLIAGVGGFREDLEPIKDGLNLGVDAGVVAAAIGALRADLRARGDDLERVSGRGSPSKEAAAADEG